MLDEGYKKLLDKQVLIESLVYSSYFTPRNLRDVEQIIGYEFKCKSWLVEALTHKSVNEQQMEA